MSKKTWDHEIKVKTGGVSIGKTTARIGIEIDKSLTDLADADEIFVGSQLQVHLSYDPNASKDAEGQQVIGNDPGVVLEGVADSVRMGVFTDRITASLQFQLGAIDVAMMSKFSSKGEVLLKLKRIGQATALQESESEAA